MKVKSLAGLTLLAFAQPVLANIDIQFDYTYDTGGFFSGANSDRRAVLDSVASVYESRFTDTLTAINSGGGNNLTLSFFDPADPLGVTAYDPSYSLFLSNQSIGENVVRVYVGAYNFDDGLNDGRLAAGMPGQAICSSGTASFCDNAYNRGQGVTSGPNPVDVAPWGGSMSFDIGTNWHFGMTTSGLDATEYDFYTVALHELAQVLGFGVSATFDAKVAGGYFNGPNAGHVQLSPDGEHWAMGTMSLVNGVPQESPILPIFTIGARSELTDLDVAAMQDIGWQVAAAAVPEADTWTMLLAGLGFVSFATRRRLRPS